MPATLDIQALREERVKLVADARALNDRVEAEGREFNSEEKAEFDKVKERITQVKADIDAIESREERSSFLDAEAADLERSAGRTTKPTQPGARTENTNKAYIIECRGEKFELVPGTAAYRRHMPDMRASWRGYLQNGNVNADLQADSDTAGGYLTAPEEFVAGVLQELDKVVMLRRLARKFTIAAQSTGIRKRTGKVNTFNWSAEVTDVSQFKDTALKFGKRVLTPHFMSGMVLASKEILRTASAVNAEQYIRDEMARDKGEKEEEAFFTGDGNQKPLGLFVASVDGISTARDFSTGNTTTDITFDGLIRTKMSLKEGHRQKAAWMFSTEAITRILLLKDGNGQYIYRTNQQQGEPSILLGLPTYESEFVPSTFTTGKYVGILGNYEHYYIADALGMETQRLDELFALTFQAGFIARFKTDGAPMLEEAFARVKLA